MSHTLGVDLKLRILFPLGTSEPVAEDAEQAIVAAAKEDIAVFGLKGLVGNDGSYCQSVYLFEKPEEHTYDELCPTGLCPSLR
jgi:hypothetical protein